MKKIIKVDEEKIENLDEVDPGQVVDKEDEIGMTEEEEIRGIEIEILIGAVKPKDLLQELPELELVPDLEIVHQEEIIDPGQETDHNEEDHLKGVGMTEMVGNGDDQEIVLGITERIEKGIEKNLVELKKVQIPRQNRGEL